MYSFFSATFFFSLLINAISIGPEKTLLLQSPEIEWQCSNLVRQTKLNEQMFHNNSSEHIVGVMCTAAGVICACPKALS